jgi:divalent metal cation (Fe/Co/Zn/Cd) transporter
MGLSAAAALINLAVARELVRVGRANHSLATEADGRHLLSDVWITVGVIAGVSLAAWTGLAWVDAATAAAVALNLLRTVVLLVWRSVRGLMDAAWPADDIARFERELQAVEAEGARFIGLRTRLSGARRFATTRLVVPRTCSIRAREYNCCRR